MIMPDTGALDYKELAEVLAKTAMRHAVEVLNLRDAGADPQLVRTLAVTHAEELLVPLQVLIRHLGLEADGRGEEHSVLDTVQAMSIAAMWIGSGTGHAVDDSHRPQDLVLALGALTRLVTPDDVSGITG